MQSKQIVSFNILVVFMALFSYVAAQQNFSDNHLLNIAPANGPPAKNQNMGTFNNNDPLAINLDKPGRAINREGNFDDTDGLRLRTPQNSSINNVFKTANQLLNGTGLTGSK